ncbi:MAG: hypothetical protein H7338_19815 [Candidatus Sericytochromatia bacterium]|nr:hypothetical protein [Candidatus Sericytochromatia bacterium]
MPDAGLTVTLNPTLTAWVNRQSSGRVDRMIEQYGLGKAMADGVIAPDEVTMSVAMFRILSGNRPTITRDTLAEAGSGMAMQRIIGALTRQVTAIESRMELRYPGKTESDFQVKALTVVPVGMAALRIDSLQEEFKRVQAGTTTATVGRYTSTGTALAGILLEQVLATDANKDGKIDVFGEMGGAESVKTIGYTAVSGANPVLMTPDLTRLTGKKDSFTFADYINFLIVSDLTAQGDLAPGSASR